VDLHLRQQFDVLLGQSGAALIERLVARCGGVGRAIDALRDDPEGDGVWLASFVDAVFADWCLDNADLPSCTVEGSIETALLELAKVAYADLLRAKVLESLARADVYG
jgi:hypothetical protein